ncbi:MAG: T9SS type A sorting domain-containing protein [Lentimicrobium sp.]|nr:T9SS type A sorting domain-containing protein [Lentimicrobium sp.]
MGKHERSLRSVRWSVHKFTNNGRGLHHGHIPKQKLIGHLWRSMESHYPDHALRQKIHAIQCNKRFDEALAHLATPKETVFDKRFSRRMTLTFHAFRLAASFFLTLVLGNLYAAVENTTSFSTAMNRIAISQQMAAIAQSKYHKTADISFADSIFGKGNGLKAGLENIIYINGTVKGNPYNNTLENIISDAKNLLKPVVKGVKNIIIGTSALAVLSSFNPNKELKFLDQNVFIQGSGYNLPFNNNPPVNVNVYYLGELIGNTQTNPDGSYNLSVILTKVSDVELPEFKAYPNPFVDYANIDFVANGNTVVSVFDTKGSLIAQQNHDLNNNAYTLNVSGLGRGLSLVNIKTNNNSQTIKLVQQSNKYNPNINLKENSNVSYSNPKLKSGAVSSSSENLVFEFTATGHEPHTEEQPPQTDMIVDYVIQQIPETGTRNKNTKTTDPLFNARIPGVNIQYLNPNNNSLLTQGTTNNQGIFTGSFEHEYFVNWENLNDTVFTIPTIKIKATRTNYQNTQINTSNNANSVLLEMTQIPQNKNAQINGTVKDTQTNPIQNANVKIKHENTEYTTTQTTNTGTFQTNMNYTEYTNPENNQEKITTPPNIHAEINKEGYQTTTTTPRNLEDIINFGEITMQAEQINLNFTFKPLTITGDAQHPENKYKIKFGNHTETIIIGNQEEINVNITTETNDDYFKIWIEPPLSPNPELANQNTPIYNELVAFTNQNRPGLETAFTNNNMTLRRTKTTEPFDTLYVNTTLVNNKHNLEILAMYNYFEHPTQGILHTNNDTLRKITANKSSGYICQHQPYIENGDTIVAKFQIFMMPFDIITGIPDPQVVTDTWYYGLNKSIEASVRNDGQPTIEYEIHTINSIQDPLYIEAQNRNPQFRNTMRIVSDSNITMAVNSTSFTSGFTISSGSARGPPTIPGVGQVIEEVYEGWFAMADPPGTSSGAYLLYSAGDSTTINHIGKALILYRNQLKKGTRINILTQTKQTTTSTKNQEIIYEYKE